MRINYSVESHDFSHFKLLLSAMPPDDHILLKVLANVAASGR